MRISLLLFTLLFAEISVAQNTERKKTKVTLGIEPDYWYTLSGTGVKIKHVIENRPAAAAGITAGDIILTMDSVAIKNIFTYQDALATYNQGDTVVLVVMRKTKPLRFKAVFQ